LARKPPEPVQAIKHRRGAALRALTGAVPYLQFMGIQFDRHGDELTAVMPYRDDLIGNPLLPALHGGATAAFLEVTGMISLSWAWLWEDVESGALTVEALDQGRLPRLPKTIDFSMDYLRSGLPRDAYARARVTRSGRRYASVQITAWQDHYDRPIAQANAHFLMPRKEG